MVAQREDEASGRNATSVQVSIPLLLVSAAVAVALSLANTPVSLPNGLPWIGAATVALLVVRLLWARKATSDLWHTVFFFLNVLVTAAAIFVSPAFGLYLFISFYEASLLRTRTLQVAGVVATTLAIAVAQTGGPRSAIFTLPIYLAFVAITLVISLVMSGFDFQREQWTARLKAANAELQAEQERSAALTAQLVDQARDAGIAEERKRLSREIHDTVAQDLVAIITQLETLRDEPDELARENRLQLVETTARDALAEARRAVAALASPRLDQADLPLALDDLLGQWREATGLGGELTVTGSPRNTGHDDDLLRVAQESLANVAKHARARRADVTLAYSADQVTVIVADDGLGFDPSSRVQGYGLAGLRSRVDEHGGTVEVSSTAGEGTTVKASLPSRTTPVEPVWKGQP